MDAVETTGVQTKKDSDKIALLNARIEYLERQLRQQENIIQVQFAKLSRRKSLIRFLEDLIRERARKSE